MLQDFALVQVKMIMATNRPDVLDPALLRPGRLDRKIEIPLPNEQARMEILKIHAAGVTKHGDIDYEAIVKLADNFNGADLRNICTEAGMFAIRDERDYTVQVCDLSSQSARLGLTVLRCQTKPWSCSCYYNLLLTLRKVMSASFSSLFDLLSIFASTDGPSHVYQQAAHFGTGGLHEGSQEVE